jgi:hypothetical protein
MRPLALGESAHVDDALRLDAHSLKGTPVRDRRHDELAGILEGDEAPISVADGRVGCHPLLQSVLPNIEVVAGLDPITLGGAEDLDRRAVRA